ncbi:uncharacterized protein LOC108321488 [Vigna angularis]|uniref:uncharacterized protein LOC108321488 n=1 Tax=Phaseolus angularis TaxID=3914 RepID=UPI0022B35A92|nr:uncharacterized protein LOC108321488 [Vigna angularis]XP_052733942.1 uncharacterized protein LOC108321488 [Vigna angularis]XP_052733943.1 uncharacterized protein LOC108321488 [Vigna angularis]XP_052733944.1 uncharacterized protein LOC108321488 [Vigna angularis]XP_052733945.1 uncharacterized protein LOC108321488 [Vigna angularis]XP_052733946.1 uncharacterized protein LOC108321488 [Vigna angularis]XP_052733947.1 uncharacterized protein LOC108321488 [Vigna angularis]XP_052733948.1 uncharacte
MVRRFGGRHRGTIFEKLAAVRQRESVAEYVREFEILVAQADGVTEEQLLGYFFAGLQEELRDLVRPYDPRDLLTAMERARDVEQSGLVSRVIKGGAGSKGGPTWGKYAVSGGTVASTEIYRGPSGGRTSSNGGMGQKKEATTRTAGSKIESTSGGGGLNCGVRTLPYSKYLKRREEGRCFHYGGPYSPGHRCAERSFKVMIMGADDDEEDAETMEEAEQCCMELSVYSAEGVTQSNTMKLAGWVRERRIIVLIDSGASHNFISAHLVDELRLEKEETPPYRVCLGDGQRKETQGCCKGLSVALEGAEVREDFYIFDLGGVDVVLGVAWLAKLGEIRVDWKKMTLKYGSADAEVVIRGDNTLMKKLITPEMLQKEAEIETVAVVWSLNKAETAEGQLREEDLTIMQKQNLEEILQEFEVVFEEVQGLPPTRRVDHQITLKEGTEPVNVRPYRYPHLMKTEIEKQV